MIRTNIIFFLITGLLAKNYLIEVEDKGREEERGEEGEDFSVPQNFQMEQDGQFYFEVLKFLTSSISFLKLQLAGVFEEEAGEERGTLRNILGTP